MFFGGELNHLLKTNFKNIRKQGICSISSVQLKCTIIMSIEGRLFYQEQMALFMSLIIHK
ncbi:MAG: hypothetical protein BGN88_01550 [Clostridiales bacterium 43-6]|nr:MAG: hypothetical protein BGN88_01550 [Clostridiales bacterium 43-6]